MVYYLIMLYLILSTSAFKLEWQVNLYKVLHSSTNINYTTVSVPSTFVDLSRSGPGRRSIGLARMSGTVLLENDSYNHHPDQVMINKRPIVGTRKYKRHTTTPTTFTTKFEIGTTKRKINLIERKTHEHHHIKTKGENNHYKKNKIRHANVGIEELKYTVPKTTLSRHHRSKKHHHSQATQKHSRHRNHIGRKEKISKIREIIVPSFGDHTIPRFTVKLTVPPYKSEEAQGLTEESTKQKPGNISDAFLNKTNDHVTAIRNKTKQYISDIDTLVNNTNDHITKSLQHIYDYIKNKLKNHTHEHIFHIKNKTEEHMDNIHDSIDKIKNHTHDHLSHVANKTHEHIQTIQDIINEIEGHTHDHIKNKTQEHMDELQDYIDKIKEHTHDHLHHIKNKTQEHLDELQDKIDKIKEHTHDHLHHIKNKTQEDMDELQEDIDKIKDQIHDHLQHIKNKTQENIDKLQDNVDKIKDHTHDHLQHMKNKTEEHIEQIYNILNAIKNHTHQHLDQLVENLNPSNYYKEHVQHLNRPHRKHHDNTKIYNKTKVHVAPSFIDLTKHDNYMDHSFTNY